MIKEILIFSNFSGGYGSELSLGDVYRALSDEYNVTTIMNPSVPIPQQYKQQYNVEEQSFNIISKSNLIPSASSVYKLIKILRQRKPAKVIANISVMPELYLACLYCRIPLYIFIRESLIDLGIVFAVYKYFLSVCSRKIIANSLYTKSMFGSMRDVELLYNNIDPPDYSVSIDRNVHYDFIYLGRLSERKGIKVFFKALEILESQCKEKINIIMVGDIKAGEEKLLDNLQKYQIRFSNIDLEWVGFQKNPARYIELAKFLVAPSLLPETFGRTLIESGALGVPVVSSNAGAYQEINPLKDFIFQTGDSNDLADKMLTLLQLNEESYQKLKSLVIKDSRRYSFDNYKKKLKSIIND